MLERNALKPVVPHFNLADQSSLNTAIGGSSHHRDNSESSKNVVQLAKHSKKHIVGEETASISTHCRL